MFRGWVLLILSTTLKFRGIDTVYTKQYANSLEGSILLILSTTQYSRGIDTADTKQDAAFSWDRFCFYYAMLSIFVDPILFILSDTGFFRGSILFLLSNTQYSPGLGSAYTQYYTEISMKSTAYITQHANILVGSILLTHSTTQYFRRVDTSCTDNAQFFFRVDTAYTTQCNVFF